MTTPIQAIDILLAADNSDDTLTVVEAWLVRGFAERGCKVRLDRVSDVDAAFNRILSRPLPYPVAIVDLLIRAPGDEIGAPRGFEVVNLVRSIAADTVIVALTRIDSHHPRLDRRANDTSADIVLPRIGLLASGHGSGGPAELVRRIHALLCERDLVVFGPELEIGEQPGMQSILHDVGDRTTLRLLVGDAFQGQGWQPTTVALAHVKSGSGSHLMRATASVANGPDRTLLVKLARSESALRAEYDNRELGAGLYPSLLMSYSELCGPHNGWSALAMRFAAEVVTLRAWITGDRTVAEVYQVMNQLFLGRRAQQVPQRPDGLAAGYLDTAVSPKDRPIDLLRLPPHRQVLVRDAADELVPALARQDAAAIADATAVAEVIDSFAREARIGTVAATQTPHGQRVCVAHGDLHADNIAVTPQRDVVVMDLSTFGRHHWADDVARLAVDLLLRGLDAGADSFVWSRFATWRETGRRVGALDPTIEDERPQNRAVIAALRWIAEHWMEVLPPLFECGRMWEWHLALAHQLLRRTYQRDLVPAKRTLALVAAYDQVLLAAQRVPLQRTDD